MSDYKIKLEDKAAFLNRLEKQGVAVDSFNIKDDKLKGYFEFSTNNPQEDEIIKTILKQSPKINKLKEMQKITKGQLAQIIREELDAAGIKKTLNEDLMSTAIQAGLDPATLKFVAGILGSGALATIVGAIAKKEKSAGGSPTMGKMSGAAPIVSDEEPLNEASWADPMVWGPLLSMLLSIGAISAGVKKDLEGATTDAEKKEKLKGALKGIEKATGGGK